VWKVLCTPDVPPNLNAQWWAMIMILGPVMADPCMIIYRKIKCGAIFGEKQKPISLYKTLWNVL
jgi:hypothetical protein